MKFKRNIMTFTVLYCSVLWVLWMLWKPPVVEHFKFHQKYKLASFFVNTKGCVIPRYNAFDETLTEFLNKPKHLNCHVKVPWTTQNNTTLNLVRNENDVSYCQYQEIVRTAKDDWNFTYSQSTNFSHSVNLNAEFIRVICYDKQYEKKYTNFHAFVPRSPDRVTSLDKKLRKHKEFNKPKEILNVVLIGIDSLSRLNHIRHMPKTRDFLLQNLSAIDFEGYTKVEDGTIGNFVPLTTGNFVEEENERISIPNDDGPFDDYNLIWKNYSNNGYSTLYAEDAPIISGFNYLKVGFADKPVDHYNRPFILAAEEDDEAWHKGSYCIWNRSESKVGLDYHLDFLRTYQDRPHFGISFLTGLTHDEIDDAAYADDDYYDFLLTLYNECLIKNTVLILFSDHGMRFGSILETDIGQIEQHMPTMYLVMPPWFKVRYPDIYQNIQNNKNSLTSPFDIYKTLTDILYFNGQPRQNVDVKQRGLSLFDLIPETRTCEDAGILPQWCVCKLKEIALNKNEVLYRGGVDFLLNTIHDETEEYPECVKRALKTVKSAKLFTNEQQQDNLSTANTTDSKTTEMVIFKIRAILTPDNADFDATLQYYKKLNMFILAGHISRMNRYGHTADCVQDAHVRKFCYCAKNTTFSSRHHP